MSLDETPLHNEALLSWLSSAPLLHDNSSERITYGKMDALSILEFRDIVIAALARIIRQVDADAPIEPQHEELKVVAHADTRTHSHLVEDI